MIEIVVRRDEVFSQIQCAANFDLQGMNALVWVTMAMGREPARIWYIPDNAESARPKGFLGQPRKGVRSRGPIAIAEHDVCRRCCGRHGVTIDKGGCSEVRARFLDQAEQSVLVRTMQARKPLLSLARILPALIDLSAIPNDAGNNAESRVHARACRVHRHTQCAGEH